MKTRSRFVSNSSSSSFVLRYDSKNPITTGEVAFEMLGAVIKEYTDNKWMFGADPNSMSPEQLSCICIAYTFLAVLGQQINVPLTFPWSINEDTYIVKKDGQILVVTCHNHDWWFLDEALPCHLSYQDKDGEELDNYKIRQENFFYDLSKQEHIYEIASQIRK